MEAGMYEYEVTISECGHKIYINRGIVYSDSYANAMKKIEDYYIDSTTEIFKIKLNHVDDDNIYEFNGLFTEIKVFFQKEVDNQEKF